MCNLYLIFLHVAYDRGSVLLWQGDEIPTGSGICSLGNEYHSGTRNSGSALQLGR